jgi:polar amino acid transport system substrate-binding protein
MKRSFLVGLAVLALPCANALGQAEAPPAAAPPAVKAPAQPVARPSRDSLTLVRERGKLLACVAPREPWAIYGPDGALSGFSIDVARRLAQDLGVEVGFVVADFTGLVQAVAEGECDLVAGGLSPTPELALFAHFSDKVARHGVAVLADKQVASGWKTPADLDRPEVAIGAVAGTPEVLAVRRAFPRATVQELPSWAALGEALLGGKVQAAVAVEPLPQAAVKQASGRLVTPFAEPIGSRGEALAVRRGDLEFLAYLNVWVEARLADGWLDARAAEWFGKLDWVEAEPKP